MTVDLRLDVLGRAGEPLLRVSLEVLHAEFADDVIILTGQGEDGRRATVRIREGVLEEIGPSPPAATPEIRAELAARALRIHATDPAP